MSECPGVVFRRVDNRYVNNRGDIIIEIRFIRLKRRSCPGCNKCYWIDECLHDCLDTEGYMIDDGRHGDIYTIDIANEHTDWETGIVDNWDLHFKKIEDARPKLHRFSH